MTARKSNDYDDVAPDASSMLESLRACGYSLPTAVADLVDNSVAAGCKHVWVTFQWAGNDSWIAIADDGCGMTEDSLRDAMKLGSRNPLEERALRDLGRFGLGLKTASLSQCRRLTVTSRTGSGTPSVRRWDLDHLARPDVSGWHLLRSAAPESEARLAFPFKKGSGTVVLLEVLDRVVGNARTHDEAAARSFRELIARVEAHLAMVFHRYIAGSHASITLYINERTVAPWDPFLEANSATQSTPDEPLSMPGSTDQVRFRGFVLPHKDRLTEKAHEHARGPAGWNAQQGFYVYRNGRLIVAGGWLGLGGSRPWTQEEHYKLARIRLDIPNTMDHLWHLDVKKSTVQPPAPLRERLTGLAKSVRETARAVFAHRGAYGSRAVKAEYLRPWVPVRDSGQVAYRIDRGHPLIAEVLRGSTAEGRDRIEAALRILEETVPVQQIWLDASEHPDAPAAPFRTTQSSELTKLISLMYTTVRRARKLSHPDAVNLLLQCEEFAGEEARAAIAVLRDRN